MIPKKECHCDFGQINPLGIRRVEIFVTNGQRELRVGDVLGGKRITAIEIHKGPKSDSLGPGMTAKITLDGMPLFTISEE